MTAIIEPEKCPKCARPLVVMQGMFFWRGKSFSGLVCKPCNALWDNPSDSFEKHVRSAIDGETGF